MDKLCAIYEESRSSTDEVIEYLRARAALEREYTDRLQKAADKVKTAPQHLAPLYLLYWYPVFDLSRVKLIKEEAASTYARHRELGKTLDLEIYSPFLKVSEDIKVRQMQVYRLYHLLLYVIECESFG